MTRMRHRSLTAIAAVAALAAPTAATARGYPIQRFRVSVKGTQSTTWQEPKHSTYKDCYNDYWVEQSGLETLRFHAPATKLMAIRLGSVVELQLGTWNVIGVDPEFEWDARGSASRQATVRSGADPGLCGLGGRPASSGGPFDCGTQTRYWGATLTYDRRRIGISLGPSQLTRLTPQVFNTCPIVVGDGASRDGLTTITSKLPASELMDPGNGKLVVLGDKTFTHSTKPGELGFGGRLTARTTVHWTLTLTRVARTSGRTHAG